MKETRTSTLHQMNKDVGNADDADEDQDSYSNEHKDPNIPVKNVEDFKYLI